MFFYKIKGRVCLDCTGDFILTRNTSIIRAEAKQTAPYAVTSVSGVANVSAYGFLHRLRASWLALRFIWSRRPAYVGTAAAVRYSK